LKEEGAVLNQQMREIKVLCEPSKFPNSIEVDVTNLKRRRINSRFGFEIRRRVEVHEEPETVSLQSSSSRKKNSNRRPKRGEPEVVGKEEDPDDGEGGES
jgi:hypothetical protein